MNQLQKRHLPFHCTSQVIAAAVLLSMSLQAYAQATPEPVATADAAPQASTPAADTPLVKAQYTYFYPDGSRLKETPTEVRILKAEQMQKNVAGKVALGALLFLVGGGTGFTTSSKDNMVGKSIEPLEQRDNLQIPKPEVISRRIQDQAALSTKDKPELAAKTFKKSLLIAGGVIQLVYEGLTGPEAEMYRLTSDWVVYKPKEKFSFISNPNVTVDCSYKSPTALSQAQWAQDNYAQVKAQMEANLTECESKVAAAVPDLLKD